MGNQRHRKLDLESTLSPAQAHVGVPGLIVDYDGISTSCAHHLLGTTKCSRSPRFLW